MYWLIVDLAIPQYVPRRPAQKEACHNWFWKSNRKELWLMHSCGTLHSMALWDTWGCHCCKKSWLSMFLYVCSTSFSRCIFFSKPTHVYCVLHTSSMSVAEQTRLIFEKILLRRSHYGEGTYVVPSFPGVFFFKTHTFSTSVAEQTGLLFKTLLLRRSHYEGGPWMKRQKRHWQDQDKDKDQAI